jgi:hypothetical protein
VRALILEYVTCCKFVCEGFVLFELFDLAR